METRTVEQVEGWDSRSFSGGYDGLRTLSDREFSGAVRAGGAWLFMLNGRIIGVYEGSLESFEDASGTAYSAPHPSLPLLFSMREQGGETQAKYYTNDTPLSEADSTLKSGNFTGFVELSENVLSGDYYVAYYGGRSMSVAFVGASEQILTGDEAFQRANDEVGIYEIRNVDLDVLDIPEPEGAHEESTESESEPNTGSAATAGAGVAGATGQADATGSSEASNDSTETQATTEATGDYEAFDPVSGSASETDADSAQSPDSEQTPDSGSSPATPVGQNRTADADAESAEASESSAEADASATDAAAREESVASQSASESPSQSTEPANASSRQEAAHETPADARDDTSADSAATPANASTSRDPDAATDSDGEGSTFEDEEKWRETTTIPSLNPDRSEPQTTSAGASDAANTGAGTTERTGGSGRPTASSEKTGASSERSTRASSAARSERTQSTTQASDASGRERQANSGAQSASGAQSSQADEASGERRSDADERAAQLRSKLRESRQQVEQLEQRLSTVESERDELERERNTLRQEVERLESKLATAREGGDSSAGRQLTEAQAFEGTNLFVRYQSKGKATLEAAASDDADADDVNANLQLEHHTQFDAGDVAVDGASFESFLENSFEYEFAAWIVEELLYEIRDTGHRGHLRDLYDAIPKVDRVDFHGSVGAGEDEDGTRQETFDVIMRDRMGNPLVVADLNASRDPTTGEMMGSLVDAATGVTEAHEELAGAFQVTASFFEPDALETAEAATSGGFLSREKRESFVKLSRKRGFHLCLVESRSGGFHLNVPEL